MAYLEKAICSSSCEPENRCKWVLKPNFTPLFPVFTVSSNMTRVLLYNWGQGVCVCFCLQACMCMHVWLRQEKMFFMQSHKKSYSDYLEKKIKQPCLCLSLDLQLSWTILFSIISLKNILKKKIYLSGDGVYPLPRKDIINTSVSGRSKLYPSISWAKHVAWGLQVIFLYNTFLQQKFCKEFKRPG